MLVQYNDSDVDSFLKNPVDATLSHVFSEWAGVVKGENLYTSKASYLNAIYNIQSHVLNELGDAITSHIEQKHIRLLFAHMKSKSGDRLNDATKKKVLGTLRHVFDYAVECGYCTNNPCHDIPIHDPRIPDKVIWTPEDINIFFEYVKDHCDYGYYVAYLILATTAMRRAECVALQYNDISFDNNTISISKSYTVYGELKDIKTESKGRRTVGLFTETKKAILEQKRRQDEIIEEYGNKSGIKGKLKPWDRIVTDKTNAPISDQALSRNFTALLKRYNSEHDIQLMPIPLKNLRHTFATVGLANGVNVPDMQRQLGHSRASTTQNSYDQYMESMQEANRKKMEKLFSGNGLENGLENSEITPKTKKA